MRFLHSFRASTRFVLDYASLVPNVASFLAIALTAVLIPWIVRRIPYFNRTDVLARRAAKSRLPGWVSIAEFFFLAVSEIVLILLFYSTEAYFHRIIHPELAFLPPQQPTLSFDLVFWLIQVLAPLMAALPLGMILANLISWSIPSIRNAENKIMREYGPGYTRRAMNIGLLKAAAIMVPMSVIFASISLLRL